MTLEGIGLHSGKPAKVVIAPAPADVGIVFHVGGEAIPAAPESVVATLEHLRTLVHSLRGWPTPLGAAINTLSKQFTPEGEPVEEKVAFQLQTLAEEVVTFTERWAREG